MNPKCGLYDTEEFVANKLCCGCGGGELDKSTYQDKMDPTKTYTMNDFEDLWNLWWTPLYKIVYQLIFGSLSMCFVIWTLVPVLLKMKEIPHRSDKL
jgi:hypothetical protein